MKGVHYLKIRQGEILLCLFQGGFYSDVIAYVAKSCMLCPKGSFVAYDKAPGTQVQDCKSCPEGKELTRLVEFNSCFFKKGGRCTILVYFVYHCYSNVHQGDCIQFCQLDKINRAVETNLTKRPF